LDFYFDLAFFCLKMVYIFQYIDLAFPFFVINDFIAFYEVQFY